MIVSFITLAPGEECEGNAFGSVCMSIWTRNSKTIAPIYMIFTQEVSPWLSPPRRS